MRILIIDDDPHPSAIHPASGSSSAPAVDGIDLNGSVMHEYQVTTPAPIAVDPAGVMVEPAEPGSSDVNMVRELIARVQELLHRTRRLPATATAGWNGTIRFGSVSVEPATQTVLRDGQPVRLTHTEFRLLLALMRRRGAIASRNELLGEVWGAGTEVSRRAVDTHIARLRRKLEEDPSNPRHILTALAWGYRFRP